MGLTFPPSFWKKFSFWIFFGTLLLWIFPIFILYFFNYLILVFFNLFLLFWVEIGQMLPNMHLEAKNCPLLPETKLVLSQKKTKVLQHTKKSCRKKSILPGMIFTTKQKINIPECCVLLLWFVPQNCQLRWELQR